MCIRERVSIFLSASSGLLAAAPVSYTHLDVYKRQAYAMQTQSGWLTLSDQFKILAGGSAQPEERKTCLLYTSRCV